MRLAVLMLLAGILPAAAQVRAWFPDGTGLEIYTEATGKTLTRTEASGMIGISMDQSFRLVLDKNKNALFGYQFEAKRSVSVPGAVWIRIAPLESPMPRRYANVPTVATVREFAAVKMGEAVTLEMLFNPATSEKIYDVIRPTTDASPSPKAQLVTSSPARDEFSLREIALKVNGQVVEAPSSWMLGGSARIDIPGHGMFVIAASDPKNPAFRQVGVASRNSLSWLVDGERVEITSKTNVLMRAENAVVWVYHDAHYKSPAGAYGVGLQTADSVEWLLPKGTEK
jgi:hypothetical protein